EMGLLVNPLNGEPMRLFIRYKDLGKDTVASASILDKNTYDITLSPKDEEYDGTSLMHELGHLTVAHTMASLDSKQLTKLRQLWIDDLSSSPTREDYYGRYSPTYQGSRDNAKAPRKNDLENIGQTYYKTSLQEYLADRFS